MSYPHYFSWHIDTTAVLQGEFNLLLVCLSYLVAVIAGFSALSFIQFSKHATHKKTLLTGAGGVTLGLGIWSMHFVAMLAFSLPFDVLYRVDVTLFSILPSILGSTGFLYLIGRGKPSRIAILMIALLLTISIGAMHFIGMYAMSMPAVMTHDPKIYVIAIAVSWGLAVFTILIQQRRIRITANVAHSHILLSGLLFGFSVASMHYLGMKATYFLPAPNLNPQGIGESSLSWFAVSFIVALMLVLMIVLLYQSKVAGLKSVAMLHQQRVVDTVDSMQDGFLLCDNHGEVLLFNKRFADTFEKSLPIALSVGDNIFDFYNVMAEHLLCFSDGAERRAFIAAVNDTGEDEQRLKIKSTSNQWWLFRKNKSATNMVIQTFTDITEQVQKEEELLESRKMASLGGLVAGVAHELNTPLGVGITALSSIKDILDDIQASVKNGRVRKNELDQSLQTIEALEKLAEGNLNVMARIIQQFKFLSIDQTVERVRLFSLNDLVTDIVAARSQETAAKNVVVDTKNHDNVTLFSFQKALVEVFNTLICNSLEHGFTDCDSGKISIETRLQRNYVVIDYVDSGVGVDPTIENRIFEPFVTTRRKDGQVGLGLHIAYNLITQKLKGSIKLAEKSHATVTRFVITIPVDISA